MKKFRRLLELAMIVGFIAVFSTFFQSLSRPQPVAPVTGPILTIEKIAADDGWALFKLEIYRDPNLRYSASYGVLPMMGDPALTTEEGDLTTGQMESLQTILKPRVVKHSWGHLSVVENGTLSSRTLDLTDWSRLKKSWVGELRSRLEKRSGTAPYQERNGDGEMSL